MTVDVIATFQATRYNLVRPEIPVAKPRDLEKDKQRLDHFLPGLNDALARLTELAPRFKAVPDDKEFADSLNIWTTIPYEGNFVPEEPTRANCWKIDICYPCGDETAIVELCLATPGDDYIDENNPIRLRGNNHEELVAFLVDQLSTLIHEKNMADAPSAPRGSANPALKA